MSENNGDKKIPKWIFDEIDFEAQNTVSSDIASICEVNLKEKIDMNKELVEEYYQRILSGKINIKDVLEVYKNEWFNVFSIQVKPAFTQKIHKIIKLKNQQFDKRLNKKITKIQKQYKTWRNDIIYDKILDNNIKSFQTVLDVEKPVDAIDKFQTLGISNKPPFAARF